MNGIHTPRLDLNLFVAFDAIYSEGNVTRAARKLNLTQSALSHALARLRDLFADPLFLRHGAEMVPSPLARALIGPVRHSLQTLTVSVLQARSFDPAAARRRFTIGLRPVLEATVLPPLMARLRVEAPGVELVSVQVDRRDLPAQLAGGTLDLAVDVLMPPGPDMRCRRLTRDTLVVIARADHPGLADGLNLDGYLTHGHVQVSSRRSGPGAEDMALARIGRHRHVALRCQHYFAACRVVAESDLLLTMPEQYARPANRDLPNRIHPLPLDMPPLDVFLYWHATVDAEPANLWLRDLLVPLLDQPMAASSRAIVADHASPGR